MTLTTFTASLFALQEERQTEAELWARRDAGDPGAQHAIARYDQASGFAFTTFASRRIRGAVMDEIRARNQPCPCGSGKKFKRCCLPKQAEAARKL